MPPYIIVPGAVSKALPAGAEFWQGVGLIVYVLLESDPQALSSVATSLFRLARWWEFQILRLRWRAESADKLTPKELDGFALCDRHWNSCLRLFPNYEMLAETTCRLL